MLSRKTDKVFDSEGEALNVNVDPIFDEISTCKSILMDMLPRSPEAEVPRLDRVFQLLIRFEERIK